MGQGDSILLSDSNGFDVLIDGGKTSAGPTVVAYIRNQAIDDIDIMIASHADADHIGGLIDVLEAVDISVEAVMYNGYQGDTATWYSFATAVANDGLVMTPLQYPSEISWGLMTAYILNPDPGLIDLDQNNASVVILIDHDDVEFLFTGDIDATQDATIIARGTPIVAEIMKVPHHGSRYSSSADFLSNVDPEVAIISVGSNPYGHPTNETLNRLTAAGAFICRTDEHGTIVVNSNGQTYEVSVCIRKLYLPVVLKNNIVATTPPSSQTPTSTSTPTPTPTSTPTPTPTSTSTPNVHITYIFYDGVVPRVESDEYAEITNLGSDSVDLAGWRLNAGDPGQDFLFPSFLINPGQSCRVYTNENHPEHCGFNYGSGSAIWNNSGDCGYLYNNLGEFVSQNCY